MRHEIIRTFCISERDMKSYVHSVLMYETWNHTYILYSCTRHEIIRTFCINEQDMKSYVHSVLMYETWNHTYILY